MKEDYRIGDLARATDTAVETVRYYERIGLLPEPPRTEGNYRLYGEAHLHRLRFIRRARALGFHLDVIRDLLGMVDRPDQPCASVDQLARAQMAEVDAKIADLTRLRAELAHVANQCHGGTVRECRIVEALSGAEGETAAPATSPTPSHLGALALLVRDYDEAIGWYRDKLGFNLLEDTDLGGGKRWVRMAPRGDNATCLLLARAVGALQEAAIGNQAGGRVFLFLHTDDFTRDHAAMLAAGVHFLEEPRHESYASVAVFQDLYGNKWDLLQRR